MKYVNMNEVAFDPAFVAFPGLGNCHGIVYMNTFGLFAFHNFGPCNDSVGRIKEFGKFVRNHVNGRSKGICLYGTCPENRYVHGMRDKEHAAELKLVAKALGFKGPIKVYRWDDQKLNWKTAYVEFQYNRTSVQILVENFSKGTFRNGPNAYRCDHKSVKQQKILPKGKKAAYENMVMVSQTSELEEVITGVSRPGIRSSNRIQVRDLEL